MGPMNINPYKELRDRLGMTQQTFGHLLGFDQAAISHYETGRRNPNKTTIDRMIAVAETKGVNLTMPDVRRLLTS
jgi:DNA-binding transcriptional regulator YiaG